MKISYKKIAKNAQVFEKLFGIKVERFSRILEKVKVIWKSKSLKRARRPYKLIRADTILS
ncbi:MAG: hypothetical protein P857_1026 [Candidatus Xenolissoclinum pacificiensis L6]|uniref:Uncharacterized protein n=1 Tax=Candidatus Xenolissoclinum pacificiensis L6 TaxID=1401685 RepID=W2V317_9RICK|nr:MAG: hypothetical protein P857_1026 [Candidatus Xenolissoclinum pacificiensis L6]